MGEKILNHFGNNDGFLEKALSCKLLLAQVESKVMKSLDSMNWIVNFPTHKMILNFITSHRAAWANQVRKITIDKRISEFLHNEEDIRFCIKLFNTFENIEIVELELNIWYGQYDNWNEVKRQKVFSRLFSKSPATLRKVILHGYKSEYYPERITKMMSDIIFMATLDVNHVLFVGSWDEKTVPAPKQY